MIDSEYLLTDAQVIDFIINGYLLLRPELRPGLNEEICRQFDANGPCQIDFANDPYFEKLLDIAPGLHEVFAHPAIEGAFTSLLGANRQNFSWYCHALHPGGGKALWHQDDINVRHRQIRRLTTMYYPQDVTADMGPTYVVPSTHFFDTPTDQMATLGNIQSQVALTVRAGTLALTAYDLWHSASTNTSDKVRYMVKLYTDRLEDPREPFWNHNRHLADGLARNRFSSEMPTHIPTSQAYKLRHLRWHAWEFLKGNIQAPGEVAVPGRERNALLSQVQGFIGDPRL